jgi:hypothetical protein
MKPGRNRRSLLAALRIVSPEGTELAAEYEAAQAAENRRPVVRR